jgi:hypothetical protein
MTFANSRGLPAIRFSPRLRVSVVQAVHSVPGLPHLSTSLHHFVALTAGYAARSLELSFGRDLELLHIRFPSLTVAESLLVFGHQDPPRTKVT